MKVDQLTKQSLIDLYTTRGICLEGNILKIIDVEDDENFKEYINKCIDIDKDVRRKRLEITRQVQDQNRELILAQEINKKTQYELEFAMQELRKSKVAVENDLDIQIKKNQNELISQIIKVSLLIIIGVGIITSTLYAYTIISGQTNQIIESSWANMFSILLTNSFSIIGTIMGVKYSQGTKA
jgi:hypothetical protein